MSVHHQTEHVSTIYISLNPWLKYETCYLKQTLVLFVSGQNLEQIRYTLETEIFVFNPLTLQKNLGPYLFQVAIFEYHDFYTK